MNLRTLDLNLLTVFDAIYRMRNISRAAEQLHMSQPAVSNALSRLRDSLNDPLFIRTAHGVEPTPRAAQLAGPIREALGLIQSTVSNQWAFRPDQAEREFRIAMSDYGESVILPLLAGRLAVEAPGVTIRCLPVSSDLQRRLARGDVDLVIGNLDIANEEISEELLFNEHFVTLARRDHPVIQGQLSLAQFAEMPQVRTDFPVDERQLTVDVQLAKLGRKRHLAVHAVNFQTVLVIVSQTDYIGTLPRRLVDMYVEHLRLQTLEPPLELPTVRIRQLWHQSTDKVPAQQWLRGVVRDVCHVSGA